MVVAVGVAVTMPPPTLSVSPPHRENGIAEDRTGSHPPSPCIPNAKSEYASHFLLQKTDTFVKIIRLQEDALECTRHKGGLF